ncbi:hypothetical protein LCGC14_1610260 [marine sediment metagenome]|uniref:Uncharacterized protein n=1 Tax=marine sediment metagenome TaxID=412755 RepID=A0A0F9I8R6_9ZZZZ
MPSGSVKERAIRHVAQVAMADLIGTSEPPEGTDDQYPFNAVAWRKSTRGVAGRG